MAGRAARGLADLCRRPRDLALTLAASAAYLVGAAASAALPSPGGLGSTEAALVAALAALGTETGPALQAVLLFRTITFWAPVPIGLLTCRTLRRRRADGVRR